MTRQGFHDGAYRSLHTELIQDLLQCTGTPGDLLLASYGVGSPQHSLASSLIPEQSLSHSGPVVPTPTQLRPL